MAVSDEERSLEEVLPQALMQFRVREGNQGVPSAHAVRIRGGSIFSGPFIQQATDLAVRISEEEIERAEVRIDGAQARQALGARAGERRLMRQDDPIMPIVQADASQQPSAVDERSIVGDGVAMQVECGAGIRSQNPAGKPVVVPGRRDGMLIARLTEIDILDGANAELDAIAGTTNHVVGWGDQWANRPGHLALKPNATEWRNLNHANRVLTAGIETAPAIQTLTYSVAKATATVADQESRQASGTRFAQNKGNAAARGWRFCHVLI